MDTSAEIFDCIIIGGGPAGLYGGLYLARFCRKAIIIDNQNSRASLIPLSHNYPGYVNGITGKEILELLKNQIQQYGVEIVNDCVTTIQHEADSILFSVSTLSKQYLSKTILLATGIQDNCPDQCKGDEHILSGALHHCLICDGYEMRNKKVIVFGFDSHAFEVVQGLMTYTQDIYLITCEDKLNFMPNEMEFMLQQQVKIYDKSIALIKFTEQKQTYVKWTDGEELLADAAYLGMGMKPKIPETINFNIDLNENDRIDTNKDQMTSFPGIFAAGDICNSLAQITNAFASAALAAREIHQYIRKKTEKGKT